jgi:hypothetical protein
MIAIRTAYSHHLLRAHVEGFAPLTLRAFVSLAAHAAFMGE